MGNQFNFGRGENENFHGSIDCFCHNLRTQNHRRYTDFD